MKELDFLTTLFRALEALAKYCYPTYDDLVVKVNKMLKTKLKIENKLFSKNIPTDQPDLNFTGPFKRYDEKFC